MGVYVGVDIGGTKTAAVLGRTGPRNEVPGARPEADGLQIIDRAVFPTDPRARGWRDVLKDVVAATVEMRARHGLSGAKLEGVGVSCGGPLDSRAGLVLSPPNLPGWDEVPVTRVLESVLGCPAALQNDANACALAEWRFGAGRGSRNMVFLTFGTGMGAGLILDGRLYEGTADLAGEVGHVRLAEGGPEGYGKEGSFEGFCSGGGIARLAQAEADRELAAGRRMLFCRDRAELPAITAQSVAEAAEAGDEVAREILAVSGRHLGRGVAMLIDILNPQRIVIGSIYARSGKFFRPAMEAEIAREALAPAARVCTVVPAELGEKIGDYACLSVAMRAQQGEHDDTAR
jgi:glucokinase